MFHILGCFLKMSSILHKTEDSNYSSVKCWGSLALQSTVVTVWFPLSVTIPTLQIMSSVKVMCRRKASTQVRPCCIDDHSPRGNTGSHYLGPWISGRYLLFLGGSTDMASFLLPFHSQHHLGCARLTSKLDITAAASLTFTTSPFTSCAVTALIYSQRTNPGATVTSASAAAARPFLLRRLRSEFLYYSPSKQGRCHNHFQTLPVLQAYSFWTFAYILQSCLFWPCPDLKFIPGPNSP